MMKENANSELFNIIAHKTKTAQKTKPYEKMKSRLRKINFTFY